VRMRQPQTLAAATFSSSPATPPQERPADTTRAARRDGGGGRLPPSGELVEAQQPSAGVADSGCAVGPSLAVVLHGGWGPPCSRGWRSSMASLWIAHSHGADGTAQRQIQALVGVSWSGQDRSTCLLEDERRATSSPRGVVSRRGVICSPHGGGGGVRRRSVW
jgi:hypothetical protein